MRSDLAYVVCVILMGLGFLAIIAIAMLMQ
ncbi:type IV secretory pathway component VirB8 [Bradyrhizobium japonicum]|jgi:type IV secretory pathway component VirB8|uniref:Type IV secretory pathway component VirB8 n=1 Tax=Bradyrhizobium elkanii TaxID=29448 RepID=A0A8I1Y814_BRAEL|nr:type IV secretory pathway component VirB8 [Bradyrhizobium elkanii]MCS4010814.1 type IV secretory pathway component VirB8 [Bradyrhizobium elkanii USDA 61]MBP2431697.1 type IV secretory pathway component VirB8 [Bradyrhizobium elkanii]MCP1734671.1 type IV secretory pathway component VirB8 [Bradyrhizobium elkanii]MCP1752774.1 type IV secretory pathway component VirB8 [Bradyrhizobium elkanii]